MDFSKTGFSMVKTKKITFCLFLFRVFTSLSSQEADYPEFESKPPEFMQLIDNQPLILNDSYCLQQITAKIISINFYGDHNRSSNRIKIMWYSKAFMTSIKVESDSFNDSYCEAENKHYYYRKPLNQSFHIFPDEVHEGFRFLPIKLDCKYIITPELDGKCSAVKLKYSAPVCIGSGTCTCRKVNIPGPNLESEMSKDRISVFWSIPKNFNHNISSVVISLYSEEDGINIKKLTERKMRISDFITNNSIRNKQYFQINITSETAYRIQGYFENSINCRGNSTFLFLRHSGRKRSNHDKIILHVTAVVSLIFFIIFCLLYFWKKKLRRICQKLFSSESPEAPDIHYYRNDLRCKEILLPQMVWNPFYVEQSRDSYLFDFRDLIIIREIASGNFGIVYLAYSAVSLRGCNEFAIKQIKDTAGPEGITDFIEEINIFKLVGDHTNVVKMFGYCSAPQPLTIIMEYVPFNLLTYLKNLRAEFEKRKSKTANSISCAQVSHSRTSCTSLTDCDYISQSEVECIPLNKDYKNHKFEYVLDNKELEIFGLQIAKGMAHLESRSIVHRDLAARNVLMDNARVLKISDFGMSKTGIYVNKRSKKFPLRWMSPEALISRVYSNKSDVWSFGVVLWEIGTLGAFPYSSLQNEEVISLLEKGGHLDRPENVTAQLYNVMVNCWARSPDERPSFRDLVEKIEGFCQKSNGYVDFENLESHYVFPPMEEDIERQAEAKDF